MKNFLFLLLLTPVSANALTCAELQDQLNAVPVQGALIKLPVGRIFCPSSLKLPDSAVALDGAGVQLTQIVFPADSGDGIVGTFTRWYGGMPIVISNLTIAVDGKTSGAAIRLSWPEVGSINEPAARIHNVTIRPYWTAQPQHSWGDGIVLDGAWNSTISDVTIHGNNDCAAPTPNKKPWLMTRAIHLKGRSNDTSIRGVRITCSEFGIDIGGRTEGPRITDTHTIGNRVGIRIHTQVDGPLLYPWGVIADSFVNAAEIGIMLENHVQVSVTATAIYHDPTYKKPFVGLYVSHAHDFRATGNHFYVSREHGWSYGVLVSGSNGGTITGNTITGAHIGLWLVGTSSGHAVMGNTFRDVSYPLADHGKNNVIEGNVK